MARFNFGKRNHHDDEGVPPEPLEGETELEFSPDTVERGSRVRRPLIIAAVGILVIGGLYLANILFFSAPPAPSVPVRPVVPVPPGTAPAPPAQVKEPAASPKPPPAKPSKPEVKAETKSLAPASTPSKTEGPAKPTAPASKPDAKAA